MISDLVAALDFDRLWREVRGIVTIVVVLVVALRVALLLFGEFVHRRHP